MPKTPAKSAASDKLDLKQLDQLSKWLESSSMEEVEIESAGTRIRLRKPGSGVVSYASAPAAAPQTSAPAAKPEADTANAFKSPMVGTFYRSTSPDASPLVKEGDQVSVGQPLAIIEAMKTMNQIESDRAGTVKKILAANAQAVEFGQPLFIIQ